MNEAEWFACTNPERLGMFLSGRTDNRRKVRLAACGCVRLVWPFMTFGRSRAVVEMAERYADGDGEYDDLYRAASELAQAAHRADGERPGYRADLLAATAAVHAARADFSGWNGTLGDFLATESQVTDALAVADSTAGRPARYGSHEQAVCAVYRCVFGNPFRPAASNPDWLTSTVVALARQAYESRDFSALPILADALQDAGCDDEDALAHCRAGDVPHARGCWVVDTILRL